MQRNGYPSLDTIEDPLERLSIETSHPLWLVNRWFNQYGFEKTKEMCMENLHAPHQTARVNENLTNIDDVIEDLYNEGFTVETSETIPTAIKSVSGNLVKSNAFKRGQITIQDESSMIVGFVMDPGKNEKILDACAAPGGKTTHLAEKMKNTGKVIALDLHKHKVKLIDEMQMFTIDKY